MNLRHAREGEAGLLSAIAFQSKAHWLYSAAQLAAWREDLTISSSTIWSFPTYVAEVEARVAGFFVLEPMSPHWNLEHFWVLPQFMNRGVGRALLLQAASIAAKAGVSAIAIDADPNAEMFYLACGAERLGSVPAPIKGMANRERPQLLLSTKRR